MHALMPPVVPTASPAAPLGVPCFSGDLDTAARLVIDRAISAAGGYVCLANVHVLVTAQHDHRLKYALDRAWAVFPDGAPVAWLQRRDGFRGAERIGGPDLMAQVCRVGLPFNLRHFLLGSTSDVIQRLRYNLEQTHPDIAVVGSYSPTRREIESDDPVLLDLVREHQPNIVWCAFGAPRQELWMSRNATALSSSLVVGVGAAFDFIAGTKPRAPVWVQRAGFEWLHRAAAEPRRLSGRYLITNSEFLARAIPQVLAKRSSSGSGSI